MIGFQIRSLMRVLGVGCLLLSVQVSSAPHGGNRRARESFVPRLPSPVPSLKTPCSSEQECASEVKLKDGTVVGSVVSRIVSDAGIVEEYVKDRASGLIWSPQVTDGGPRNDGQMNWAEAKAYCESKKGMGLKWILPSKEDFRVAFYPDNPEKRPDPSNKRIMEVLDLKDRLLWSSSVWVGVEAWRFNGYEGGIVGEYREVRNSVRCAGR
jgi:hypothetical protein